MSELEVYDYKKSLNKKDSTFTTASINVGSTGRVPNIVGPIVSGSKVYLMLGGNSDDSGKIICKGDSTILLKRHDDNDFYPLALKLERLKGKIVLKDSENAYFTVVGENFQLMSSLKPLDVLPNKKVDKKVIYAGVEYELDGCPFYLIPADIRSYYIINGGVIRRKEIIDGDITDKDIIAMWTDKMSDKDTINTIKNSSTCNGWINDQSKGCIFTDRVEASLGYYYEYSKSEEDLPDYCVENNFGSCKGDNLCRPDYRPKIKENGLSPYSCNPKVSVKPWSLAFTIITRILYVMAAVVIFALLVLIGLLIENELFGKYGIFTPIPELYGRRL
jgi:hypothetical protein